LINQIMLFSRLNNKTKTILSIQSVAMLMGTSTHLQWVNKNGLLSEHYNAPLFTKIFWDSLTFLDPLTAILLFIKPKTGIVLALVIIIFDVLHNNLFYFEELYLESRPLVDWIQKYWMITGQIIFAIFVIATFKSNNNELHIKS